MRVAVAVLLIAALLTTRCLAQQTDSTHVKEHHSFQFSSLVAPATLITMGSVSHSIQELHDYDIKLRDYLTEQGLPHTTIDNYLQYLPLASSLGLKTCGLESVHSYKDISHMAIEGYLLGGLTVQVIKYSTRVLRPDNSSYNSFPSGHTFTAFIGAEIIRREYGEKYPGVAIAGYMVASGVGLMRAYNSRHWIADILGGAGIGILAASSAYWTYPWLNKKITSKDCQLNITPLSATLSF